MGRLHLIEFEDKQWFPSTIRNYMTDFLQHIANTVDFYKALVPILKRGVESSGEKRIIDLASGGGGGWKKLGVHLSKTLPDVQVHLTDYYPNTRAFEQTVSTNPEVFTFETKSVNALDVPSELKGLRTQFLSFHHFKPEQGKQILQNAVDAKSPILLVEAQQRSVGHFVQFFFSPINVLFLTPMIKPFKIGRIIFTYLIPIVPLFVWWDGLVSVLRTYSEKEMRQLIDELNSKDDFEWEISSVKNGRMKVYYTLGIPKS